MIDCKVCIHYDCCCGWTSKEVIDSTNEAMEEGDCQECNYYEPKKIGKWIWINQATGYMEPPYGDTCKCSECGFIIDVSEAHFKHCPECCAKMTED